MDAYSNLQAQIRQIQDLMNPSKVVPIQAAQKQATTIPEVDGLEGARMYLKGMAASSSAAVFDKNEMVFFGLSVDANGNPGPIKRCPFTVEDAPEPGSDVLTKADLEEFKAEIRAALAAMMRKEEQNESIA